jgi:crotonobetainyl-CoA:carnitine CoA-transferase CaiB-like acyl-CoA transferase
VTTPPAPGPLQGVRVVDLGLSWAAPFTGMLLADMGAEVIRVESHQHLDILRWSAAFVDGVRHFERSGYYMACNRGKRSVTLNLKTPRGRELLLDLVEQSDVLIENFSPRVLESLHLGVPVLHDRNPRLVILSMSGYGATGPDMDRSAYGDHLLHASGFAAVTGHPDDPHTVIGTFYGDPVGGLYGALGVLAALDRVGVGGAGEHLEYSQVEGLLSLIPTAFMAVSAGEAAPRRADKSPSSVPHGFYRCAGDDAWVALAVRDDDEWARLAPVLGFEPGAFGMLPQRLAAENEIDSAVAEWAGTRSPWEVTDTCQSLGVAGHPVHSAAGMILDDHLAGRGFFRWVHRPLTGPGMIPGVTLRIAGDAVGVRGPAPTIGEHNDEILHGLLGISTEEIGELVRDGVVD